MHSSKIFHYASLLYKSKGFTSLLRRGLSLGILAVLLSACLAQAEFIKTRDGLFQSLDKKARVLLSHSEPGVLILMTAPTELQLFDPSRVSKESTAHLFIRYDPSLDQYSGVLVGAHEYRVRGGLSIVMQHDSDVIRVTIDNTNPYLSIVTETNQADSDQNTALLGFRGLQVVVNESGQDMVALLEANRFNRFAPIIYSYTLADDGLRLKGEPVTTSSVGVELEPPRNVACLEPNTLFLSHRELARIKAIDNSGEAAQELEKLISKAPAGNQLQGILLLRIESSEMIGLDFSKGAGQSAVKIIRPLKTSESERNICVIETAKLGA